MLACHIPGLIDYKDTAKDSFSAVSGTVSFLSDSSNPFTNALILSGTSLNSISYVPPLAKTTELSLAFWYKCTELNNTTSQFQRVITLSTTSAIKSNYSFRLERVNNSGTYYKWYNNGNITGDGGLGGFDMIDGEWYHIALNINSETGEWEQWIYRASTKKSNYTSGKISLQGYCYFEDYLVIEKQASIAESSYCDIRVYDNLLSEYQVQQLQKRLVAHYHFDSVLDSDYTELDYIESDGTHYIDTEVVSSPTTRVIVDYQYLDTTQQQRVFSTNATFFLQIYINSADNWAFSYQDDEGSWTNTGVKADTGRHTFDLNGYDKVFLIDDGLTYSRDLSEFTATKQSTDTFKLFSQGTSNLATARIYSCKIYSDSRTLVRDFIPVKNNITGAIGLYDKVNNKFYGNSRTGSFIASFDNSGKDYSGLGTDAEVASVPLSKDSKVGYSCAEFNGSTTYVRLPRTTMIEGPFTCNFWAYMDNWSDYATNSMRLVSCTESGGWNFESTSTAEAAGIRVSVYDGIAKAYKVTSSYSFSNLESGWHMFTAHFDGTNMRMYIDAVQRGINSAFTDAPNGRIGYHASNRIFIGAEAGGNTIPASGYFKGKIDDFKIYASALTEEDIQKEYSVRARIDDKNKVHCKWLTELPDGAINLVVDPGFEHMNATGTNSAIYRELTSEESFEGNSCLKVQTNQLVAEVNLNGFAEGTVTTEYNERTREITLNGTSNAGVSANSFIWVPLPEGFTSGQNVTVTATWISGERTLTNATSGSTYACPVVDMGKAIGSNVTTRHYSDFSQYPNSATPVITKTLTITDEDIEGGLLGIRVWCHIRGASSSTSTSEYGATIVNFNNYKFKIDVTYASGTKDRYLTIRDASSFLRKDHRYYVSVRVKSNTNCEGQIYLGAWETHPVSIRFTNDDEWHFWSGITGDYWKNNFKDTVSSQVLRFDFDANVYSTDIPTSYWDDVKVVDLTDIYGCGLRIDTDSPEGNRYTAFKFQLWTLEPNEAGTRYEQLYTSTLLGEHIVSFVKDDNSDYIRFGFNGSQNDGCKSISVRDWPNGTYTFKVTVLSMTNPSDESGVPTGSFTIVPIDFSKDLHNLYELVAGRSTDTNIVTTLYDTSLIPSKVECDAKFNGVTSSATSSNFKLCDGRGTVFINQISEFGRPMRYIRITMVGSNKNSVGHLVRLYVNTISNGKICVADAYKNIQNCVSKTFTLSAANTDYPYFDSVTGSYVWDIGTLDFVSSIFLQRYFRDGRYYYQTKIEGSTDNIEWFTVWDSHNTGTYSANGSTDSTYNTYIETAEGTVFTVDPDKVYITKTGTLIANEFLEE